MQFEQIMGYEEESEIHSDLGFSEVAEALVVPIVFDLAKDRFGL